MSIQDVGRGDGRSIEPRLALDPDIEALIAGLDRGLFGDALVGAVDAAVARVLLLVGVAAGVLPAAHDEVALDCGR